MSANKKLYPGEPNKVKLANPGLRDDEAAAGVYINNAAVTADVRTRTSQDDEESEGDSITDGVSVGTATCSNIAASNGEYLGYTGAMSLTPGTKYWLWFVASGYTVRRIPCIAAYRLAEEDEN